MDLKGCDIVSYPEPEMIGLLQDISNRERQLLEHDTESDQP